MRTASLLLLGLAAGLAAAWSKEDHEIFRLRDEVASVEGNELTFYDFIGVTTGPSATQDELNKAYRKTSQMIHPDKFLKTTASKTKNKGEAPKPYPPKSTFIPKTRKQADDRFARLGLVAAILRGPERERYDHFLRNGFPRWRGTGYYYSRFRPGLLSVLIGLWVTVGGGVHYVLMILNARQQKQMMERYISDARTAAWGKDSVAGGLNIDPVTTATAADATDSGRNTPTGNRRQRRDQAKAKPSSSGTSTPNPIPAPTQHVAKRKVTSDNGKTFMVTSLGDVSLVDEDADGNQQEYLLDVNEIAGPDIMRTAMVRVPIWAYGKVLEKLGMQSKFDTEDDILGDVVDDATGAADGDVLEERLKRKGLKKRAKGPGKR